ncbi:MAG: spore coat U domain-containing protein [Rouxiella aceris]|uniref:Csu type fimbrial protein n=1 Tax=Rouxiella aceris TaxID=2703884 RepID=UPI002844FEFD|nr:spore coat U domain-containing protein [Rouxiella aceris]MDR3434573.1 spore coat U domain-containing protein [Rouxiella aceris]
MLTLSYPALAATTPALSFTVSATISSGCAFGSTPASPASNLGTLNFGSLSSIPGNIDIASSSGAGSVVVTCTPGTAVSIAMDYGLHGGNSTQRYLANSAGTATLAYQLYQDSAHSKVWGNGTLAMSVAAFPATSQTYNVYGRLFAVDTLPAAGIYSDTVNITLTY